MRIITDLFAWAGAKCPEWNTISISGYHIREAGSTADSGSGVHVAERDRVYRGGRCEPGLEVDAFRAAAVASFSTRTTIFWKRLRNFARRGGCTRVSCGTGSARKIRSSMMLRFHAQTAGSTLTAQQPEVNVVRVALQAMAAVLGGTQSLHTNGQDEALSLPTERSARLALAHPAGDRV